MNGEIADCQVYYARKWQSIFWGVVALCLVLLVLTVGGTERVNVVFVIEKLVLQLACTVFLCTLLGLWVGSEKKAISLVIGLTGTSAVAAIFAAENFLYKSSVSPAVHFHFCYLIFAVVSVSIYSTAVRLTSVGGGEENVAVQVKQFGLWQLLSWVTSIAVLLTIGKSLKFYSGGELLITTIFYAVIATLQCFIWTRETITDVQVTYLLGMFILFFLCCSLLFSEGGVWAMAGVVGQAMLAFSLYCLRKQNYRLMNG